MYRPLEMLRDHLLPYWRTIIVIVVPLAMLPLPILAIGTDTEKAAFCGYVILLMAIYWMTEALPLPITSLIPVVLFPLLGILDTGVVCMAYMKETNMMFIGGLMLALAVEYCNLHKRIALGVLLTVGSSPRWLMLGFMLTTAFLSMWISNTATTAMMVPIVDAVVQELFKDDEETVDTPQSTVGSVESLTNSSDSSAPDMSQSKEELIAEEKLGNNQQVVINQVPMTPKEQAAEKERKRKIRVGCMMSIAYASNIGGTGSQIGSSPQLALKGILEKSFGSSTGLNFATWMAFNIPGMLINLLLAWLWIQLLFIGFRRVADNGRDKEVKQLLRNKYKDLGPMTFHEFAVLILFICCVLLWFFRSPEFVPGWASWIKGAHVDDATAVMLIMMFMFSIPAEPKFWCLRPKGETGPEKPSRALLDWKYVQDRLPWGIVLLLGGGFALSDACKESGLSTWLGEQLSGLSVLPPFAILFIVCVMTAMITEVASNTATANILLPVLSETSIAIGINPLYLMLPATVTCSYAFMLPVATPPNAIVFSAAKMDPLEMMKSGFLMNIFCVIVICVMTETLGVYMFDLYTFPDWANQTDIVTTLPPCFTETTTIF